MLAIPCNQIVDTMNRGYCDVNGVVCGLCGDDLFGKKHSSNRDHVVSKLEERNADQQIKALRRHLSFTFGALVQYGLRADEIELMPMLIPPYPCEILTSCFNESLSWPPGIEARDRCFDVCCCHIER